MAIYKEVRDQLNTGDIVLFSSRGIGLFLTFFTPSKWSHVGMVVKLDDWDEVLLWESTPVSDLKDVIDKKAKKGVQTVFLSDRIKTYKGEISIRRVDFKFDEDKKNALIDFRGKVKDRDFENDEIEIIKAYLDGPFRENKEDLSSLFCSELVAEAYQKMKLLKDVDSGGKPSNEYTPMDFSEKGYLDLRGDAKLGNEIPITYA